MKSLLRTQRNLIVWSSKIMFLFFILSSCVPHQVVVENKEEVEDWNQYAVKFVCGKPAPKLRLLSRGRYFTAINVHNPQIKEPVDFWYKVAVAEPKLVVGQVTEFQNVLMRGDGALEIDCPNILELTQGEAFRKGFVVIVSREELDVVAVYTAGREPGAVDEVQALHMERVPPRPIKEFLGGRIAETCSGAGCCCNSRRSESDPNAGNWPDCSQGFTCVALEPGGVPHPSGLGLIDVNVCVPTGSSPLSVPFIHSSQPSFCRIDVR